MSEVKEKVYSGMAPPGVAIQLRMIATAEGIMFINTSINGFSFVAKPGEMYEFELMVTYPSPPIYAQPSSPQTYGNTVIINQQATITNTYNLHVHKIKITDDV